MLENRGDSKVKEEARESGMTRDSRQTSARVPLDSWGTPANQPQMYLALRFLTSGVLSGASVVIRNCSCR